MQSPLLRPRPTSVAEFRELVAFLNHQSPLVAAPPLRLDASDVMVATYPKCGTTWVQQIVHGLRTRGSMDFEEISLVVPWIETAGMLGIDLDAPQVARPRAFKTHLPWDLVPKGGRNVYVVREPGDVLVSFYHFLKGLFFEGDAVDLDAFAVELFLAPSASGRYWENVRSWWQVRAREDVLVLCFEDMKADLRATVARIAAFIGTAADAALIDLVTRQSSFAFMHAHESQFDDHPTTLALCRMMSFPPARTTKVRAGRSGDGRAVSPRIAALLEAEWQRQLAPLGLRSYDELRARLNRRA
jgi:Sulfotransferase domain